MNKKNLCLLFFIALFQIKLINSSTPSSNSNKDNIAKMAIVAKYRPMALEFTQLINPIQEIIFEYLSDTWQSYKVQYKQNIKSIFFVNEIPQIRELIPEYANCLLVVFEDMTAIIIDKTSVVRKIDLTEVCDHSILYLLLNYKEFDLKNLFNFKVRGNIKSTDKYYSAVVPYQSYEACLEEKPSLKDYIYISKSGKYIAEFKYLPNCRSLSIKNILNSKEINVSGNFSCICFSQDEKYIAYANMNFISLLNLETFEVDRVLRLPELTDVTMDAGRTFVRALAFSNDSKLLYAGTNHPAIKAWDIASGELKTEVYFNNDRYRCLFNNMSVSPDLTYIYFVNQIMEYERQMSKSMKRKVEYLKSRRAIEFQILVNQANQLRNSPPL